MNFRSPRLSTLPSVELDSSPEMETRARRAADTLLMLEKDLRSLRTRIVDGSDEERICASFLTRDDHNFARDHLAFEVEDIIRYREVVRSQGEGREEHRALLAYYELRCARFERVLLHRDLRESYRSFFRQSLIEARSYVQVLQEAVR
jgi:hypothetical protein